jgi:hypothetical protein
MTGATPDCEPQPGQPSPALGWSVISVKPSGKGGGQQGDATAGLLMKIHQKVCMSNLHFFYSCHKFKKDSEEISAGKGN